MLTPSCLLGMGTRRPPGQALGLRDIGKGPAALAAHGGTAPRVPACTHTHPQCTRDQQGWLGHRHHRVILSQPQEDSRGSRDSAMTEVVHSLWAPSPQGPDVTVCVSAVGPAQYGDPGPLPCGETPFCPSPRLR